MMELMLSSLMELQETNGIKIYSEVIHFSNDGNTSRLKEMFPALMEKVSRP